jgi:hypothetical protein
VQCLFGERFSTLRQNYEAANLTEHLQHRLVRTSRGDRFTSRTSNGPRPSYTFLVFLTQTIVLSIWTALVSFPFITLFFCAQSRRVLFILLDASCGSELNATLFCARTVFCNTLFRNSKNEFLFSKIYWSN